MATGRAVAAMRHASISDPDWFAILRVGDVLRAPGGSYRVVRRVGRDCCGRLTSVTFTIQRCSWTKRPTTVYIRQDLKRGWHYVGVRVKLDREIDRKIAQDVNALYSRDCAVSCCAVLGIA